MKYAHVDACASKFSGVAMPATPGPRATLAVTLLLPKTGPCSDIRNVCVPGHTAGGCQVALADKLYDTCPMYEAVYRGP